MKYKCLSIAGFDGSGGAGIQADLKTFSALGCYGMTVLTALPVQNTCGVRACYDIPLSCIEEQLEAIFDDIIPDAIKIGMLFSEGIIHLVTDFLEKNAKNIPIVLDPVMIAKSDDSLLHPEAIETLKTRLLPIATLITPNLPEAYALTNSQEPAQILAEKLITFGAKAVLIKGGHANGNDCNDLLLEQHKLPIDLNSNRIHTQNTHGTGCTLSAAICSFLARGSSLLEACQKAKYYLTQAILASKDMNMGQGFGPVHHFYEMWREIP
jgi:hydroxymethylpyrimidine/phosphomethylpyrimidine kinase